MNVEEARCQYGKGDNNGEEGDSIRGGMVVFRVRMWGTLAWLPDYITTRRSNYIIYYFSSFRESIKGIRVGVLMSDDYGKLSGKDFI